MAIEATDMAVVVTDINPITTIAVATMKRDLESSEMVSATTARRRATRQWTAQKEAVATEAELASKGVDTEEAAEWRCALTGVHQLDREMMIEV